MATRHDRGRRHPGIDRCTPMAIQTLADLCGDDDAKRDDCAATVMRTLGARAKPWGGILAAMGAREAAPAASSDV